ncbi:MAG TPA: Trx7/PDZ domain-containing (seleno)protein [Verrucomicrobiae bacterium]|nr:Trx7/PDZ domain-containing (seleno)protein [Verrucomicrobiae bacterium]
MKLSYFLAFVLALSVGVLAETVKDRKGAVLGDKAAMENDPRWIYNDWKKGLQRAELEGKPALVVLRCVPCLACAGIDASILEARELQPLLDKFVKVRVINANALDLSLFQVDYDLSFSAVFFNGDGTVYGRYGSWTHQKSPQDKTTAGFQKAMESVLAMHRKYPANKAALKGKQGVELPFKDPLEIPGLAGKYKRTLDWEGQVVQSCVHCHMIGEAIRSSYRAEKKQIPNEWIYPWPAPETIGLTLATEEVARVQKVAAGSIAEKAGIKVGDEFTEMNGQALTSIADVSWVLHRSPESGAIQAEVLREGKAREVKMELPAGWRNKSDIARRVGTWEMRAMALGGLFVEDLSEEERAKRGVGKDSMALFVKHAGEYGVHAAAKKAGFRKDDVLVSVDGIDRQISESELIGHLLHKHEPGEKVKAVVLRGQERVELMLPIQ